LPRFTIATSPAPVSPATTVAGGGGGAGTGDGSEGPPATEQSVSTPAHLLQGVTPAYPAAARAQGIEADVPMELVVSRAGAVESARVVHHAGFGFDEAAI